MALTFSPSALTEWLACPHAAALALQVQRRELEAPDGEDPSAELIFRKGIEHEERYLHSLRERGLEIVEISFDDRDWVRAERETADALRAGADVVYQAALVDGDWRGLADFVERQPEGSYEVVDTKLARHAKPGHLFQLCFYSAVVGRLQGRDPEEMHLVLGNGTRATFRVSDYDAYYRRIRDRFVDFVHRGAVGTHPYPVAHCAVCVWRERCAAEWEDKDHLSLVAGIRRNQVERLVGVGVTTLAQLAETLPDTQVPRIADDSFGALREQAALQLHHRRTKSHKLAHLPPQERRGFRLLPAPAPGDVYYDIEGDPFHSAAGSLEYLHGVTCLEEDGPRFRAFWAVDEIEEKRAFEELVDFVCERRRRYPALHVYHYANYERAALQRLMQKHGTREDEVDDLLRHEVLVDLYQVVRQALRISLPSYSLKQVETLYFPERTTEVAGGADSTVAFERFLETGDRSLLDGIEAYNRDDCDSTFGLHWWLVGLRPELPWAAPREHEEMKAEAQAAKTAREALQARLDARGDHDRWLAAHLLDYHRRDAKPAWWDYFRHLRMDERELIEDATAIGGINLDDSVEPYPDQRSLVYELVFPPQDFKVGRDAIDPFTESDPGTILEIDEGGRIKLKRGKQKQQQPLPRALVAPGPYRTWEQQDAVMRVVDAFGAGRDQHRAAQDILTRARPRARLDGTPVDAVLSLDRSYLFVQGPPGSGKTYAGAEMAVELMRRGRRVGVAALSHKAIHNFLDHVVRRGVPFTGWKKCSEWEPTQYRGSDWIENVADRKRFVGGDADLIAGTSYLFSYEGVDVDTLFIDEAGQIALADALAMATSATNVVLLGDPNQLPQVSQGAQPPEVRASVLEHLLRGHGETIPAGLGLFLEQTWRLRPELCRFVSEEFYEGRLEPAGVCAQRSVSAGNGVRFAEVAHAGNRQAAPEEAAWVADEIERLCAETFTDEHGRTRPLTHDDFLVVAPYNAQVRCLRGTLPDAVRVGTVDKFQGQEAPVVFFSMTSSSGEDVPRGLEFLFSRNRFNVAVSRAQCLAYVVASPTLLVADAKTPEQMRLVNTVCRFAEAASRGLVGELSQSTVRTGR